MDGTLRVTPEELLSTSQQFQQSNTTVSNLTQQMMNIASELNSSWAGEAAQAYYGKLKELETPVQKLLKMIEEHTNDLQNMGKAYQKAEQNNQQTASNLSVSGIV